MNKVIIVALVVCLVSVHAFVKRDTEKTETKNHLEMIKKQFDETLKGAKDSINNFIDSEKVKESLDPEKVKQKFQEVMESIKNMLEPNAATTEKKE